MERITADILGENFQINLILKKRAKNQIAVLIDYLTRLTHQERNPKTI